MLWFLIFFPYYFLKIITLKTIKVNLKNTPPCFTKVYPPLLIRYFWYNTGMKNKLKSILEAGVFTLVLLGASLISSTSFAYFSVYRPFGGRILSTPTTPTINCFGAQGDITTSGTFGQSSLLVIPSGTRTYGQASSGKWILGLNMPMTTPTCTIGEPPYESPYNVYNVRLYGLSR